MQDIYINDPKSSNLTNDDDSNKSSIVVSNSPTSTPSIVKDDFATNQNPAPIIQNNSTSNQPLAFDDSGFNMNNYSSPMQPTNTQNQSSANQQQTSNQGNSNSNIPISNPVANSSGSQIPTQPRNNWNSPFGQPNPSNAGWGNNNWGSGTGWDDMGSGWGGDAWGGGFNPSNNSSLPFSNPPKKLTPEERVQMIEKVYEETLGRKPDTKDINYYKYSSLNEEEIQKQVITGKEHKELLENGREYKKLKERVESSETRVKTLESQIKDQLEEFQKLGELLKEKNKYIQELRLKANNPYNLPS